MQKQFGELDSNQFRHRMIFLKWQNIVREIKLKMKFYEDVKDALVVSNKKLFRIFAIVIGLYQQNGFPEDSKMQTESEEAAMNQMLSLSRVAAQKKELQVIADSLNVLKR